MVMCAIVQHTKKGKAHELQNRFLQNKHSSEFPLDQFRDVRIRDIPYTLNFLNYLSESMKQNKTVTSK